MDIDLDFEESMTTLEKNIEELTCAEKCTRYFYTFWNKCLDFLFKY